ncbi:MAG: sialidase family protein [Clostridia bacterium]|nr:sialidase family protein [Clostridia bacterium]
MRLSVKEFIFSLEKRKTPACHASTLIRLSDGRLMAAWFGGNHEGSDDVEIWRAVRWGQGWSEPEQVSPGCSEPCWNPVLYRDEEKITLWYKQGTPIPEWRTMVIYSYDEGYNWTHPRELVPGDRTGGRGPVKDKPILLKSGRLLAGASHESMEHVWLPFADLSDDQGKTWFRSAYLQSAPKANLIQPTVWESPSGVHALMRSNAGRIYRADSRDGGVTWSTAYPIDVPNNNSGIDCALLADGRIALVCNPVSTEGCRTPVSLLMSEDDGIHFKHAMDLETGEGEFSYPAVICDEDRLHITFTHKRERIMYCCIEL